MSRFFPPLVAMLPAVARAQTQGAAAPPSGLGGGLVQMSLGLVLVLAILFVALYALKRLAAPRGAASGFLRVIAAVAVGPRERVVVVEAGDQWLVVGVAPGRVTQLSQMARQTAPAGAASQPPPDFAGWLKQIMERKGGH